MMILKRRIKGLILLILALGLSIASSIKHPGMFYVLIFIAGIIVGRVVYLQQPPAFKWPGKSLFTIISTILFLLLIFASPFSQPLALLLFLVGATISYYLHHKKIVGSFKSKPFVT